MKSRLSIPDQHIIDCLSKYYGIKIITLTPLALGADMNSSVYKAESQNATYFVKLKKGHGHDISIDIMELLQKAGIKQIIPIIKTTHGQSSQHLDDFTVIVYPYIEGQNGFNRELTDEQWLMLGKALRQVHEIKVTETLQKQLRRETYDSKWRDRVRSFYKNIESKPIGDDIAIKFLEYLHEHLQTILRLVDRAEQLADIIQKRTTQFVLCHTDIHGGNVLLDKNNNLFIIDWDEPMMAPKERDLMFIGGGVANVWNRSSEEKQFYNGYGETHVDMTILAYYRHERIVEDIALACQDIILKKIRDEDRAEIYKHFIAMFEQNGVIDIAFKTDERLSEQKHSPSAKPKVIR